MDKLAEQLRIDARRIDASVSPELQQRIDASLRATMQERPADERRAGRQPTGGFWWASSLTGLAAALLVIVVINARVPDEPAAAEVSAHVQPPAVPLSVPSIDWKTESAMLTSPLRQEWEDLQADIKKAEQKVKADIGL